MDRDGSVKWTRFFKKRFRHQYVQPIKLLGRMIYGFLQLIAKSLCDITLSLLVTRPRSGQKRLMNYKIPREYRGSTCSYHLDVCGRTHSLFLSLPFSLSFVRSLFFFHSPSFSLFYVRILILYIHYVYTHTRFFPSRARAREHTCTRCTYNFPYHAYKHASRARAHLHQPYTYTARHTSVSLSLSFFLPLLLFLSFGS